MTSLTVRTEARHPIGVVADRTGLSPDLLRIWERRYRAVSPPRTNHVPVEGRNTARSARPSPS